MFWQYSIHILWNNSITSVFWLVWRSSAHAHYTHIFRCSRILELFHGCSKPWIYFTLLYTIIRKRRAQKEQEHKYLITVFCTSWLYNRSHTKWYAIENSLCSMLAHTPCSSFFSPSLPLRLLFLSFCLEKERDDDGTTEVVRIHGRVACTCNL